MTIQYTGMTKIVITTDGNKNFKSDLAVEGATAVVDGTTLTITFTEPANSVTFALTSQVRVTNIAVYTGTNSAA